MQSREPRFVLCIESGDQEGDRVPLSEGTLAVGRRPECGLVLKDGSVSGKHAEIHVAGARVELVDLGSTNGTRVGGQKIERIVLGHGDAILFGNVRASLHDSTLAGDGPPITDAPAAASPAPEPGALGHVSAELVSRSRAASKRPLLLVLLLVLVGLGAGAFFYLRSSGGGAAGTRVAVQDVPGNLVADGTFEEGTGEWSAAESAPVAFLRERAFAATGLSGLGVSLEEGAWSLARSAEFPLRARRALACAAALRVEDGAVGRFGVELLSSTSALPPLYAWAPARRAGAGFEPVELAFDVQGGYDRARLLVAGTGRGTVALDDASALEREPVGNAVKFTEYELAVLGAPGSSAMLVRSGRALLAGFDLSAWNRAGLAGWPQGTLAAAAGARGFVLSFPGAPDDASLHFQALRADDPSSVDGWVATIGAEGYAAHGADFSRAGVTSLMLGRDTELLRMGFARPVEVHSSSVEGALVLRIALAGLEEVELQLTFGEERGEAAALAERAAELEKKQDLGGALAVWTELLDRFPFERKLVTRASEARGRLVETGLEQVGELRREMERARFFQLPELFEKGEARALELARQYTGSEVEAEARATASQCAAARSELSAGQRSGAEQRLRGVLGALDPATSPRLVEHLRGALAPSNPPGPVPTPRKED